MPLTTDQLEEIVAELVSRPGHEKVRTLIYKLLTDGLGAPSRDITFEQQTFEVRGRMVALLGRMIATARAAETMPWTPREVRSHTALFPYMAEWLPKDEGEQLLLQFESEMERLRNAA